MSFVPLSLPFIDHVWCDVIISSCYVIMGSMVTWPLLPTIQLICTYMETSSSFPLYLSVSFMPINSIMALYGHTDILWSQSVSISPCSLYAQICSSVMSSSALIWFCAAAIMTHIWAYLGVSTLVTSGIKAATWAWHELFCFKNIHFFVWK